MPDISMTAISFIALAVSIVSTLAFLASRYRRCTPNQIMVISGKTGGASSKSIHGGGAFIMPLIQEHDYISLVPMTIDIDLRRALSNQNIRVNVPCTFTVAVSAQPQIMDNAAKRLLGLTEKAISELASEVIFGQLRQTIAEMKIEEINQDRDKFLQQVQTNVTGEINKIGLDLINVNVRDLTDEANYIESIGQKAASEAVNKANVDVALQDKTGAIGVAAARRDQEVAVAEAESLEEQGKKKAETEQRVYVQEREAEAIKGEKAADTDQRIFVQERETDAIKGENTSKEIVAKSKSELAVAQYNAQKDAQVSQQQNEKVIQEATAETERARLHAERIVPAEIAKSELIIQSEATKEQQVITATGEAEEIRLKAQAKADGARAMLDAKAEGFGAIIEKAGSAENAIQLLVTEQLPALVNSQAEILSNLEIDNLTVWGGGEGSGTGVEGLMKDLVKALPPIHDLAKGVGLELPEFLGKEVPRPLNGKSNGAEEPVSA